MGHLNMYEYVYIFQFFLNNIYMDYKEINNLLKSLEIADSKKLNYSTLDRDINLNNQKQLNLDIHNPQRQYTDTHKLENTMNDKINNYNFVQTKQY